MAAADTPIKFEVHRGRVSRGGRHGCPARFRSRLGRGRGEGARHRGQARRGIPPRARRTQERYLTTQLFEFRLRGNKYIVLR